MRIFESKPDAYPRTRRIYVVGEYDSDHINYCEGYAMGNSILFDSRRYVMPKEELKANFERSGNDD